MSLGDGGFYLNIWDGESLENRFQLDRKGKVEECQYAIMLLSKYSFQVHLPHGQCSYQWSFETLVLVVVTWCHFV